MDNIIPKEEMDKEEYVQTDLFTDVHALEEKEREEKAALDKESDRQKTVQVLKDKFGKNAVFLGTSLEEGATGRLRNEQIGGHKK